MSLVNFLKSLHAKIFGVKEICNNCGEAPGCQGIFMEDGDACDWVKNKRLTRVNVEPIQRLPDGSAFMTASFPLPSNHWLTKEREYLDDATETVDFPAVPILAPRKLYEEQVRAAAKWAVRASTDCGKEIDFDPDAMVLNMIYALCGPMPTSTCVEKPSTQAQA